MPGKVYCGKRICGQAGPAQVWVQGKELSPERSFRVRRHSPDGFQWGYCGSAPAQLALALLLDALGRVRSAAHWYQTFKRQVVGCLPDQWVLTQEEILAWYASARQDNPGDAEEEDDGETEVVDRAAAGNSLAGDGAATG